MGLGTTLRQMLMVKSVRSAVGRWRYRYFRLRGRVRTLASKGAYDVTVEHNLLKLDDHASSRMNRLIRPLASIESLGPESRILVIGPRTEGDLLNLVGHGFSKENVRGLDLISYSPWIDLGDMHDMPYEDDTWDAVVLGWCLAYSKQPQKVADEVLRVTKPGGFVAIGLEYSTIAPEELTDLIGYSIADEGDERVNSVPQILELFEGHVDTVFFAHDAPRKISHGAGGLVRSPSAVITVFSISDAAARDAPATA